MKTFSEWQQMTAEAKNEYCETVLREGIIFADAATINLIDLLRKELTLVKEARDNWRRVALDYESTMDKMYALLHPATR